MPKIYIISFDINDAREFMTDRIVNDDLSQDDYVFLKNATETFTKAILFSWILLVMVQWVDLGDGTAREYSWNPFAVSCQVLSSLKDKNIFDENSDDFNNSMTDQAIILRILKHQMWTCTDSPLQLTAVNHLPRPFSTIITKHSKQTCFQACYSVSWQVFINTRPLTTLGISFPKGFQQFFHHCEH